ncbi:hypothetical protein [Oceanobacillus rekensis]|uniref:hypothetical protein n=1 Tax=Oceanobacillus rekensis TaxID=937927 RepID=UPI000B435E06|nr:hypothetical protein [Oceanobacillus rekensis]
MRSYFKLVNFELGRFMKIYLVLIGITIISQIAGVIVKSRGYLSEANQAIIVNSMPKEQFLEQFGQMSMGTFTQSIWFMGPIALCIAALIFYCFFIWYRDWFGKNTFIYRLLMLPTARLHVFLAKVTTIFLLVIGLVSIQLILLPIESMILKFIVPIDLRADLGIMEIISNSRYLFVLVPDSFIQFIINYGIGFMVVFIIFTAILFERSFRLKGILLGIVYSVLSIIVFIFPLLLEIFFGVNYLYPTELFVTEVILAIIVICAAIWTSNYLINKKVTV